MAEKARRVREMREEHGWSRRELARRAGVAPATVDNLENGTARLRRATWFKLADALEVYGPLDLLEYREQRGIAPDANVFMLRADRLREGNLIDLREAMDRLSEEDVDAEYARYKGAQRAERFREKQKE